MGFNLVKILSLTLLIGSNNSIASEIKCKLVDLIKSGTVLSEEGKLCEIRSERETVHQGSPLQNLSFLAKSIQLESEDFCEKQKLKRAENVTNFRNNSFSVDSTGVHNTRHGSSAFLGGKFLCVPNDSSEQVEWRKKL